MQNQRHPNQPPLEPNKPQIILHRQQICANYPPVVTQAAADRRNDVRPSDVGDQSD
jgi:hypothetical protein